MRSLRLASLVLIMLLTMLAAPMATTAQGNSAAARACQKGGYLNYTDADGNKFRNTGQCVSYAARGGTLVPIPIEPAPTPALVIIPGNVPGWTGAISVTGFTPNSPLLIRVVYSPSGGELEFVQYSTDEDGAFIATIWNYCDDPENGVTVTVTDSTGVSATEFLALDCGIPW